MRTFPPETGRLKRYGIAVLAVAVAFVATYASWPFLKPTPWALFFAAVMISAWFGGQGPGLAAMALIAVVGQYFFVDPPGSFTPGRDGLAPTLVFIVVSAFISILASARRQAEAHERSERRRFQATVSSIGDAVIATDAAGRVSFMNAVAEELTGWELSEAVGRSLVEVFVIVNEETREKVPNPVEKVLQTGRIQGLANHTVLISKNGTERPIADSAAPIQDDRGEITGVVLVFRDVTQEKTLAKLLRASEERPRIILESITDGFFAVDREWRFTYVNPQFERILGQTSAEVMGRMLWDVYPGLSESEFGQLYRRVLATRESESATAYYEAFARWYEFHAYPAADGLTVYFRDVTSRVRFEQERREFATRNELQARVFDTALSNSPDFVYTFDLQGRFTYASRSLLSLLKKDSAQVVGRNFFELDYPPELAARLQRQIQQVIDAKGLVQDETPFATAQGERYYEYIFVPVLAPDGTVEAVAGSTRDVTERRQVEEATRRRAFQLQKLADIATRINAAHDVNSVVGVVTEEAGRLIGAELAATSMVSSQHHPHPPNVVSTASNRTYVPDEADIIIASELYEALKEETRAVRLAQAELDQDPRWRTLERVALIKPSRNGWLAAPLVGRNGQGLGLLQLADKSEGEFTADDEAIIVQLSRLAAIAIENARLYQELRGNDERKDEFLAMLAHELRNPLAAISNAVKVAVMSGSKEHIDFSMEVITRQMQHLSRLIDDLMDVSRITRGKIELRRGVMEMSPILDSAAATVGTLVEERKHTLDLSIDRGNLWANIDPTRLEQVVVNLLNNAAKYSENGGHIRLTARVEGEEVVISIKDRGVGIPPEKLPEMFELFAQGDRSLARSEGGLGIGLTVVKKLVEMHGGIVAAASEVLVRGSEFVIRLPAARKSAKVVPTMRDLEGEGKRARILVVDDNVDTARGMERLLRLLGHEVATAHNGPEAIESAREFRPEFILLDIGLPGMSGYEVASQLRREECCKGALIIAVSGYGQVEDRRRSKAAGFDYHLTKPLDHDALLTLLSAESNGRDGG